MILMRLNNNARLLLLMVVLILGHFASKGQLSEEVKKVTPELPGEILVDFGFNLINNAPDEMDMNWWRSKSVAIWFVKPFDLSNKISFRPGIGVNLEKLGTKDPYSVGYIENELGQTVLGYRDIPGNTVKSQLALNYAEIPIEMRYHFSGNDKNGVYLALGGTFAFLFDDKTKIKYEISRGTIIEKNKDNIQTSKTRLSAYGRIGFGAFGAFYKWYFTDIFTNAGPPGTMETSYSTIGISVSGF